MTTQFNNVYKPMYKKAGQALFAIIALVTAASTASAQKRFQTTLRDAKGTVYTIYLQAQNEKRDKDHLGRNQISGDYYVYLRHPQWKTAQRQNLKLFDGERRGWLVPGSIEAFALRSKAKGQPDVFVVEQFSTGSLASASVFFIQNDRLQQIVGIEGKPLILCYIYRFIDPAAIRTDGAFRYKTRMFDNSGEKSHGYHLHTWGFNPAKKQFVWLSSKKDDPPNAPWR